LLDASGQTLKRLPPWIDIGATDAVACAGVQVLPAVDAKSLAVLLAERTPGQGEQHLFAHDVLKQQTVLSIIPYFGLVFGDCAFAGLGVRVFGAEEEVEVAGERDGDRLDAAGAEDLELALVGGADADVLDDLLGAAMFDDEVGFAADGEWAYLAGIGCVVDCAGGDGLVEEERFILQVERSDEHEVKGRTGIGCGQMRRYTPSPDFLSKYSRDLG
jgi:hypothetical protein